MLVLQYPTQPKRSARFIAVLALVTLSMLPLTASHTGVPASMSSRAQPRDAHGLAAPLAFEANVGQAGAEVRFLAHTPDGGSLLFRSSEVELAAAPARDGGAPAV